MYKKVSKANVKAINSLLQAQAALGNVLGVNNIQQNRYMRDCSIGDIAGVDKMNLDLHGWDGVFKNGVPFENKNIKATSKSGVSYALKFQDTNPGKLNELVQGVIAFNSFWNNGEPAFLMVGNTKNVGAELVNSYNPYSRCSSTVSMSQCIKNGFKLVAVNWSKQQVIDAVTEKFPRLGKSLTLSDIYTEKEVKSLVKSMMA